MKNINLKSLITLNFLSVFGYLTAFYWILFFFYRLPNAIEQEYISGIEPALYYDLLMRGWYILADSGIIVLVLIISAAGEYYLRKKHFTGRNLKINIPKLLINFHKTVFWLGIILVPSPVYLIIFTLLQYSFSAK